MKVSSASFVWSFFSLQESTLCLKQATATRNTFTTIIRVL